MKKTLELARHLTFHSVLHHEPWPTLTQIEIASFLQIPGFQITGLAGQEVQESKERVRAAIEASGFEFPRRRVLLHLAPASVQKKGAGFDLAIALGILGHQAELQAELQEEPQQGPLPHIHAVAWGELSLDGRIHSCGQVARALAATWLSHAELLILPPEDEKAAQFYSQQFYESPFFSNHHMPQIIFAESLKVAFEKIKSPRTYTTLKNLIEKYPELASHFPASRQTRLMPLDERVAKTLAIAAGGGHHLLLLGPKGSGKSHLLEWLETLLPPPPDQTKIFQLLLNELNNPIRSQQSSATGATEPVSPLSHSIVRRVAPQCRPAVLTGSVQAGILRPGELALAHGGLLIADEFAEWPRDSRETLRGPLEESKLIVSRAQYRAEFPCDFIFAATANFCPCGGTPPDVDPKSQCRCSPLERSHYLNRLSGPILDRIDLVAHIHTGNGTKHHPSTITLTRLKALTEGIQRVSHSLFQKPVGKLTGAESEKLLQDHPEVLTLLLENLSPQSSLRSRHKILRVAISLAIWDHVRESFSQPLDQFSDLILLPKHFIEASLYRSERWLN